MSSSPEIDIVRTNKEKMLFLASLVSKQRRTPSVKCHMQICMTLLAQFQSVAK